MDSNLKCSLCLNHFDSVKFIPQIFNCGHTFCRICIEKLIKSRIENELKILNCPICNKIVSEKLENNFPENKLIIDLIDLNGNNFLNMNLNEKNSDFSIINNAFSFCENYNKKLIEKYEIIRNNFNFLVKNKTYFYTNLQNLYEKIIDLIIKDKEIKLKNLDNFYTKKIDQNNLIDLCLQKHKRIVDNSMKKITELKEQKFKSISISDQLTLINDLNLKQLNNEKINDEIENYINNIFNNNLNPIFNIDKNILTYANKLLDFIQIEFPNFNLNENTLNQTQNDFSIDDLNESFSNIKISFSFIWPCPNTSKIYKYMGNNKWNAIEFSNPLQKTFPNFSKTTKINSFQFIITGGLKNNLSSNDAFLFTESANSNLSILNNMIFPRRAHGACLIKNNFLFVCGGIDSANNCMKKCEILDVDKNSWNETSEMLQAKCNLSLICVNGNFVFNFGGRIKNFDENNVLEQYSNSIEMYDFLADFWKFVHVKFPFAIECVSLNFINNKEILVCGGYSPKFGIINYCFSFDVESYNIKFLVDKHIKKAGFVLFDSIKSGSNYHIFLGGNETFPEHILFKYDS